MQKSTADMIGRASCEQYPANLVEPMGEIKDFLDSESAKYIKLTV